MAVTDDPQLAARMRLLCNHGRTMDGSWLDQHAIGFNYRLPEIQAAMGVAQMQRLDSLLADRRNIVDQYRQALDACDALAFPEPPKECLAMSWFALVLQLKPELGRRDRDQLVKEMAASGIQLGRYFAPLHLQPALIEVLGARLGDFPVTESIADRCLALPLFVGLSGEEIQEVCDRLLKLLGYN